MSNLFLLISFGLVKSRISNRIKCRKGKETHFWIPQTFPYKSPYWIQNLNIEWGISPEILKSKFYYVLQNKKVYTNMYIMAIWSIKTFCSFKYNKENKISFANFIKKLSFKKDSIRSYFYYLLDNSFLISFFQSIK